MKDSPDLQLAALAARHAGGESERTLRDTHERIAASAAEVWIHRLALDEVLTQQSEVERRRARGDALPLFGVPFAVKDNIDVAGLPTTAACPDFAYVATETAPVVRRLLDAGAILFGKTNLDQFATGLVGVRSPYGSCKNPFDRRYVSGGSSSGSAVAVATGLVSFALGTDTAGSGRVPAALCNIVGLKPTRGRLSSRGVVPACCSLDCVSVFAGSCADAAAVLRVAERFDSRDPFSRDGSRVARVAFPPALRVGVPRADQLQFFGDVDAERLYRDAVERLVTRGATPVEVDLGPFLAVAELLYAGPWVAERLEAAGPLLERRGAMHPVVRSILEKARLFTALDAYRGQVRLRELRREAETTWERVDLLLLPTTPTTYSIADVEQEPVLLNSRLGTYTNFVNLLDLAALAVPAGFRKDGLPLGVSLIAKAWSDEALLSVGAGLHAALGARVGATLRPILQSDVPASDEGRVLLAVAGAHLRGEPLNGQLTSRGARFVRACRSAPAYRLFALAGTSPPKPGLVHTPGFQGEGIELEVWSLTPSSFGSFVDEVPAPLAIGSVRLDDGTAVKGFVCEPFAVDGATDITVHGGWRKFLGRA